MKAKFLALAALVLGLASCQTDPEVVGPVANNAEVDFQLSVAAPELATRAGENGAADEQNAMNSAYGAIDYLQGAPAGDYRQDWDDVDLRYTLEVYDVADNYAGATPVKDRQVIIVDKYEPVAFDLRLVPNRDYHFVVFADFVAQDEYKKDATAQLSVVGIRHDIGATLADITVKSEAINDEVADSYFATKDITVTNSAAQDIVLRRPYGKVRVIATDLAELNLNVNPYTVEIEYEAYNRNKFNAVTGKLNEGTYAVKSYKSSYVAKVRDNMGDHFYNAGYDAMKATAVDGVTKRNSHITLFTDYILALPEGQTPIHFNMVVKDEAGVVIKETAFTTDIPVERNKLTTVIGNVLTSATEIEVRIDENFAGEIVEKLWTGDVKAPAYDEASQTYTITEESELAWLAAAVNGTLENTRAAVPAKTFKGETFILSKDLDLNGEPWTPIGVNGSFEGTFDGQGHVIYNLFVDNGRTSNAGLFGTTQNGEIKNLVVENANIKGRLNVAVIAGNPYTSKYTNITVRGHVEVNGMAYVGGVGGKNAYANWENITVNVDETSYVNANSVENGTAYRTYVGGVVGFNGEGGHSFKNITSNIDVQGSTCDVGGLFGIAHYGNQFENCTCSGNVEIYAAEESAEAEEIGGIAGVWNNADDTEVVMKNVEFTGEVTTNITRNTVWYGNLVGKYYAENDLGVLTLNGLKFTRNGADFSIVNDILTREAYTMPFDLTGSAKASNGYGATGINHANYTLDGGNHTIKVSTVGTWGSAIATRGGTIKNITIAKGFRGIFVNTGTEPVILENVTIDGPTYTISCDAAGKQGIEAYESTFNGWTSYAGTIGEAYFEDCSFGYGAGYKFARPYAPTTFVNCDFCEGYQMDPRAKVTFINCRVNGVDLTPANYDILVTSNKANAEFKTEDGHPIVGDAAGLNAALAAGYTNILLLAGNYELSGLNFVANNVTLKGEDKANVVLNLEKSIYLQDKSITLENLTYNLNAGKGYTEQAFAFVHHATAFNLKNCNVNRLRLNVYEANIEDCTFTLNTSSGFDGYCIYYYGNDNSTVNVKNSTFATAGKGICIYSEHAKAYNLNVDKCSFTSSDSATDKAAIQMHTELGISGNVKITETTATGFANINGGLWNELNNNTKVATDKFDIWVDGTQVH